MTRDAIGTPRGNFPTFRCDDGSRLDLSAPCPEFSELDSPDWAWIKEGIHRDYARMKSRQVFFYCVGFHLTGDDRLLALARDGLTVLRRNFFDSDDLPYTYLEDGSGQPPQLQRTSQDLAYALNGFAFYYYLTRDRRTLRDLLRIKTHIFDNYYDSENDMLRWVAHAPPSAPPRSAETERKELVAQLDQINAYMLLVTPYLPEPHRTRWTKEMVHLSHVMIRDFYSQKHQLFWGSVHDDSGRRLGSRHTDFGHTIKALWMIERVGRQSRNESLIMFSEQRVPDLLFRAYDDRDATWGSKVDQNGRFVRDREWWIHCELDQVAATWALHDSSISRYLPTTYGFWMDQFVDKRHGGIYHMLTATGERRFPKAHLWKNGFHESEHALIGYITAQVLRGEPVVLYYAPREDLEQPDVQPYLFFADVERRTDSAMDSFPRQRKMRVEFDASTFEPEIRIRSALRSY
jgi:mannose/cellobiose epimerase-like protein (N-acyl-D-glucosamine 2-epimerase family)